jgi:hypothetical protein
MMGSCEYTNETLNPIKSRVSLFAKQLPVFEEKTPIPQNIQDPYE